MVSFFCLSNHEKDIVYSAAIVSSIAKKLGSSQLLIVRTLPAFFSQYPNVTFVTDLPECLSKRRRTIHEDVISEGSQMYVNTWVHQLRDLFMDNDPKVAIHAVAKNCMLAMGLRKRISGLKILESSLETSTLHLTTDRDILVCITEQACAEIEESFINQVFSSLSRFDFVVHTDKRFNSVNCYHTTELSEFAGYMKNADIIISTLPHTLIPFYNITKKKNIFLTVDDEYVFKKSYMFTPSPASLSKLIIELKAHTP